MVLTEQGIQQRLASTRMETAADFHSLRFQAMGTECHIDFSCEKERVSGEFRAALFDWLARFEARYSRFVPTSLLSRINEAAGREAVAVERQDEELFALCDWYFWLTRGIFDPTALPLLRLWDYKAEQPEIPSPDAIAAARSLLGWKRVVRDGNSVFLPAPSMAIDLGGIGKEYAVDKTVEMALELGVRDILVDYGHDVRVAGEPPERGPWRIGLEDPRDPGRCWAGVAVRERAVCSSGNYIRHFVRDGKTYGHIVDPRTGTPVSNGTMSTTVIAPSCTEAGILSTAAFIAGGAAGSELIATCHQAEGCVWTEQGILQTRRFNDYLID